MRDNRVFAVIIAAALLLFVQTAAAAANYKIVDRQVSGGEGYTVLRVWGSDFDMGYGQGAALAQDILDAISQVKALIPTYYGAARIAVQNTVWKPAGLDDELSGMVAGIKSVEASATIDELDLKVLNTFGDWAYSSIACRSSSTWGSFVKPPTKTLSSRRLDLALDLPKSMTVVHNHVLLARQPTEGGVRWINLAWPGYVTVLTGVNEYGTQVSIHNYNAKMELGAYMSRCVAARYAMTLVEGLPLSQHLDAVYDALSSETIATTTFLNYFVPEGHGGVLTCNAGQPCSKKRVPQDVYFGGEVLITTNDETDGKTMPKGGDAWHAYYVAGGTKTLADHYATMGQGLISNAPAYHRMSVDYRGQGDMTIWAEGLTSSGPTPVMKVEFSNLFSTTPPPTDGGTPDAGPTDGAAADSAASDSAADSAQTPGDSSKKPDDDGGCSCQTTAPRSHLAIIALGLLVLLRRRRRR